jgi:hypothetical protein
MGTRNLICVMKDNEYKIAQYGQWDGYPEENGIDILSFLRNCDKNLFLEKLEKCRFFSDEEINKIHALNEKDQFDYLENNKQISKDTGAKILNFVYENEKEEMLLVNSVNFAKDSLFCEWCYVIDYDKNCLEVYRGFNKNKLEENERFNFKDYEPKDAYYPVRFVCSFSLDDIPSNNDFIDKVYKIANGDL